MAVADLYQAQMQMETAGVPWFWGFQYQQVSGTNDATTLEEFAILINAFYGSVVSAVMSDDTFWRFTDVSSISNNDEIPGSAAPAGQVGGVSSPSIPINMAAKAHFVTNAPASKNNGGTNWSGVPASFQKDGIINQNGLDAYFALLNVLEFNITNVGNGSADFQPVIVSRWLNGIKRDPVVPFAIVSSAMSSRIGNMRRRATPRRIFGT